MWQTIKAQRVQTPHVEAQQRPTLNGSQLCEMFRNATSPEACALAAKSYAENPMGILIVLLDHLPAEAPFAALCEHLTCELAAAHVQDASTWHELLDAISRFSDENERATPEQSLGLLQGCARSLASLNVIDIDVWNKLFAIVPESLQNGSNLQAMAGIAREMAHAGIEQEVLWRSAIRLFADPRSRNFPHAEVASVLKNAGVASAVAWRLLRDTLARDTAVPADVQRAFYETLFSAEPAPLDLLALMRQFGAATLISNCETDDLAIWVRVIDAASQAGALSDVVKICLDVRSADVWRHLLFVVQSARSTEGIDLRLVCKTVLHAAKDDAGRIEPVIACVDFAASRADEFDRNAICSLIQKPLGEFVDTLGKADAKVLLKSIVSLVLGKDIEPSAAFRRLGIKHACNVLLNLTTAVPGPQRAAYRSMLKNALKEGTLGLDRISQVNTQRALLRKSAPSIDWSAIFHPSDHEFPTRKFYSSFPELQMNLNAFLKSLKILVLAIGEYNSVLRNDGLAEAAPERRALHAVAAGLIGLVTEPKAKVRPNQLWGAKGEKDMQVDQALLSRLIRDGAIDANAAAQMQEAESVLALQTNSWGLVQKAAAMRKCWAGLTDCVNDPGFAKLYDLCGDYEVAMLDPDDVANLKVGHEVACCLAPDGDQAGRLFERLAGGWIMWAVKNPQGETIAVAWGALNEQEELVIDFIDERVNFRVPPLGNNLVEHLIAFAPDVAKAVNAHAAWLAPAMYGRLEAFPAFVNRPTEPKFFKTLVPDFLGVSIYADSLNYNKSEMEYSRLM